MAQSRPCPKCAGTMSEGFIVDNTHGGYGVASWVAGAPVRSFWVGLKMRGRKSVPIEAWRCGRCGFVEGYAPS